MNRTSSRTYCPGPGGNSAWTAEGGALFRAVARMFIHVPFDPNADYVLSAALSNPEGEFQDPGLSFTRNRRIAVMDELRRQFLQAEQPSGILEALEKGLARTAERGSCRPSLEVIASAGGIELLVARKALVWVEGANFLGLRVRFADRLPLLAASMVVGFDGDCGDDSWLRLKIVEALSRLPEAERRVLVLFEGEGLTPAEIERVLEMPGDEVKTSYAFSIFCLVRELEYRRLGWKSPTSR